MSRKRSAYRPKQRTELLPVIFKVISPQDEQEMELIPHVCLDAILRGVGHEDMFLTIVYRTMIGASLTKVIEFENLKEIEVIYKAALLALISVGERFERTQKFGCNGDEIKAITDGLHYTDELHSITTRRNHRDTYENVSRFVGSMPYTMRNLRLLKERV